MTAFGYFDVDGNGKLNFFVEELYPDGTETDYALDELYLESREPLIFEED